MKKAIFIVAFLTMLLVLTTYAAGNKMAPAMIFKFDSQNAITEFANGGVNADISFENGVMKAKIKNGDSYISHNFANDNTYADDYRYVKYRFKTVASPSMYSGQFYYKTPSVDPMGIQQSYTYFRIKGTGKWEEVTVDMKSVGSSLWSGKLEIFRIDPLEAHDRSVFNAGEIIYIDYIAFFETRAEAQAYNGESPKKWVCPANILPEDTVNLPDGIVWEFDTAEEISKWSPGATSEDRNKTLQVMGYADGIMRIWDDDDNFNVRYDLKESEQFELSEYPYLKVRYRQTKGSNVKMQIYFWNNAQSWNPYYELSASNAYDWETALIDFSSGTANGMAKGFTWKGNLTAIRLDPMREFLQNNPRECYIDYIGFFKKIEDANAYASDRNTEFGQNDDIILNSNNQRVIIPKKTVEKYFDNSKHMIKESEFDDISDTPIVMFTKNGVSSQIPLTYYNGKILSFMSKDDGTYSLSSKSKVYSDVAGHWGEKEVKFVSQNSLFFGTSDKEFSPDMALSGGMFITALGRLQGVDISAYSESNHYDSTNPNEYYTPYISWARSINIIDKNGIFFPEEPITRLEMACIIDKYIRLSGYTFEKIKVEKNEFSDLIYLTDEQKNSINYIKNAGIIYGKELTEFDPTGLLTRAEAAAIMTRVVKSVLCATNIKEIVKYNAAEMTVPYWIGNTVYYESFLPVRENEGEEIEITLMYDIQSVISLKNSFLNTDYTEGIDYTVRNGKLYIPVGSNMTCMSYDEFFPMSGSTINVKTGGFLFNGGGGISHSKQYAITYTHADTWGGHVPKSNPAELSKFKQKLKNGENVTIALFGDSISTGCDSSGLSYINLPPYLPKFINLVAECLSSKYNNKVNVINRSVGGKFVSWAAQEATNLFKNDKFDLFVIAFGMNDGTLKVDGESYIKDIKSVMEQILAINPDCEFLLISTTLPNSETTYAKFLPSGIMYHESYEPLLEELANEYGTKADIFKMTSMHKYILTRKKFVDATSSNINHPNDFIIRLYAQGILAHIN